MASVATITEKQCVVCGASSHRSDWADRLYPACDNHSEEEVDAAVAKLEEAQNKAQEQAPPPAAPTPSQPAGPVDVKRPVPVAKTA